MTCTNILFNLNKYFPMIKNKIILYFRRLRGGDCGGSFLQQRKRGRRVFLAASGQMAAADAAVGQSRTPPRRHLAAAPWHQGAHPCSRFHRPCSRRRWIYIRR